MPDNSLFSGTIPTLSRLLDLRSMRHKAIASNIANVDTPDYKAFDIQVEQAMRRMQNSQTPVPLNLSHPAHLQARASGVLHTYGVVSENDAMSERGDGNTVDIDRSMSDLAENSIIYNAATQLIKKKLDGLKLAIKGGK